MEERKGPRSLWSILLSYICYLYVSHIGIGKRPVLEKKKKKKNTARSALSEIQMELSALVQHR